jgi:uncharacterized protein (TIGR02145 family)
MKSKFLLIPIIFFGLIRYSSAQKIGKFTDTRDGKIYKTVQIGSLTWMAENHAYLDSIGSWSYNDDTNNLKTYGYLYNWEAAKKACPKGWHIPSDSEWTILENSLGGPIAACNKLKEKDTIHWKIPNKGATNESGFTAIPGGTVGIRMWGPSFNDLGVYGYWWTSTPGSNDGIIFRFLGDGNGSSSGSKFDSGYSVRCLKD